MHSLASQGRRALTGGLAAFRYCSTDSDDEPDADSGEVADLEDLGGPARRSATGGRAADGAPSTSDREAAMSGADATAGPKDMLTPQLRAALGKQGYKLVGATRHTFCSQLNSSLHT